MGSYIHTYLTILYIAAPDISIQISAMTSAAMAGSMVMIQRGTEASAWWNLSPPCYHWSLTPVTDELVLPTAAMILPRVTSG